MLESAVEGIGSRGIVVQGQEGRLVAVGRSILKSFTMEGYRPVLVQLSLAKNLSRSKSRAV